MNELVTYFFNALLFFFVFKIGQLSILMRLRQNNVKIELEDRPKASIIMRPLITIEEINGIYYAYDGNDFLAQGKTPEELGLLIANRYPKKYAAAQIKLKA